MSDLTQRLRSGIVQRAEVVDYPPGGARIVNRLDETRALMAEAADEIERLRDVIKRARSAFDDMEDDPQTAEEAGANLLNTMARMMEILDEATSEVKG